MFNFLSVLALMFCLTAAPLIAADSAKYPAPRFPS